MACPLTLTGLLKDCAPSKGGIKAVYIANYADFGGATLTDGEVSAITMLNSAKFKAFFVRPQSCSMTSTLNSDPANGVSYVSTELALQFSRMETTKRTEMAALALNELVAIAQDANGKYWLLGYDNPVLATAGDGSTGQAYGDANKYGITLTDNAESFPYEVDPTAVEAVI